MPRYYFHLWSGDKFILDEEGLELSNAAEAYLQAFRAAQDLWIEGIYFHHDPRRSRYDVASASGEILFQVPVLEVLNNKPRSRPDATEMYDQVKLGKKLAVEVAGGVSRAWHMLRDSRRLIEKRRL